MLYEVLALRDAAYTARRHGLQDCKYACRHAWRTGMRLGETCNGIALPSRASQGGRHYDRGRLRSGT